MRSNGYALAAVAAIAMAFGGFAAAYDGPVEKKVFALPTYTTVGGRTLKDVRVGYETYGKLNAAGDNAIFIPHFFSGNSHAAGKYKDTDAAFGYWDPIIGSGRPIGTDKYFVVSADALANLNTKDPNTTTTGPASINPDTGKPYAMNFPIVTYVDSVRVHKALLDSLGVKKLQAAAGASGGSIQAMLWAAPVPRLRPARGARHRSRIRHPSVCDRVGRRMDPADQARPEVEQRRLLRPRRTRRRPGAGTQDRDHIHAWLRLGGKELRLQVGGFRAKDPAVAMDNRFAIEDTLNKGGMARAKSVDANSMIYTVKANQLYNLGDDVKKIKAKILFVPAASIVFPPELSKRAAERYRAQGGCRRSGDHRGRRRPPRRRVQRGEAGRGHPRFLVKVSGQMRCRTGRRAAQIQLLARVSRICTAAASCPRGIRGTRRRRSRCSRSLPRPYLAIAASVSPPPAIENACEDAMASPMALVPPRTRRIRRRRPVRSRRSCPRWRSPSSMRAAVGRADVEDEIVGSDVLDRLQFGVAVARTPARPRRRRAPAPCRESVEDGLGIADQIRFRERLADPARRRRG